MKRLVSVILSLALVVSCMSLSGCGAKKESAAVQQTPETTVAVNDGYTPDATLRILMVGNSFCYYYVEELYELLMENPPEGIDAVEIYNLYYSGCNLTQHLTWWKNGEAHYDLFKTDVTGRERLGDEKSWKLEDALMMADWDYISLQGGVTGGGYLDETKLAYTMQMVPATAEPLLDMFHEKFPHAQLLWHSTWFSEVGRVSGNYTYKEEDNATYDTNLLKVSTYMCTEFVKDKPYDLTLVHTGAAWTKARELNKTLDLLPYGGLCARLGKNSFGDGSMHSGDGYHDGDIGGAQLLNAYVWYMTITGRTDVSASTYAPVYKYQGTVEYPLSAELIAMLKEAAMSVFKK